MLGLVDEDEDFFELVGKPRHSVLDSVPRFLKKFGS